MTYTLWHAGVRIGETSFEQTHGRQKFGVFRPTAYGVEIFPRLSGILSAASQLKDDLAQRGLTGDGDVDDVEGLLETTAGGSAVLEVGKTLSEVELHDPKGKRLEFKSIAFTDLVELRRLCRKMSLDDDLPADDEIPEGGPRYVVSVTLGKSSVPIARFGMTSRDN
jgi:hypothetical protein